MGRTPWHDVMLHGSPISNNSGGQWCSEFWFGTQYMVHRFYGSAIPQYSLQDSHSEGFAPPCLNPYMPLEMEVVTKTEVRERHF